MIVFEKLEKKYIEDCVKLSIKEYKEERKKCDELIKGDFKEELSNMLNEFIEDDESGKYATIALEDEKVVGFIAFDDVFDEFYGDVKGTRSPLGANAFAGKDREKVFSYTLQNVMGKLVDDGVTAIDITRYAHDDKICKSLFLGGFGARNADATMELKRRNQIDINDEHITFKELQPNDRGQIVKLQDGLLRHLSSSPIFFPPYAKSWSNPTNYDEDVRVFCEFYDGKPIGFITVEDEEETFISNDKDMYNICGTYFDENYRGNYYAHMLLEYVCRVCEEEGKTHLGVDCETANPTAIRFWGKYFDTYAYNFMRRMDDRIIGYLDYIDLHHLDSNKDYDKQ